MSESIANKIRDLIYSHPRAHLSPEDLQFIDSLSTDMVSDILYGIYTTETSRDINAKIYQTILDLQNIDKVQFFINAYDRETLVAVQRVAKLLGIFLTRVQSLNSVTFSWKIRIRRYAILQLRL